MCTLAQGVFSPLNEVLGSPKRCVWGGGGGGGGVLDPEDPEDPPHPALNQPLVITCPSFKLNLRSAKNVMGKMKNSIKLPSLPYSLSANSLA